MKDFVDLRFCDDNWAGPGPRRDPRPPGPVPNYYEDTFADLTPVSPSAPVRNIGELPITCPGNGLPASRVGRRRASGVVDNCSGGQSDRGSCTGTVAGLNLNSLPDALSGLTRSLTEDGR